LCFDVIVAIISKIYTTIRTRLYLARLYGKLSHTTQPRIWRRGGGRIFQALVHQPRYLAKNTHVDKSM